MTEEELPLIGNCPLCGGDSDIIRASYNGGYIYTIVCKGPPRDGGSTYCGAKLDGALDAEALKIQAARWNGDYNGC
jgi:hypothetical protein